ncbi:MAG: hypothetical protein J1F66_01790 [Clostridiales bacterium]|nr:hypothetical protein [Clostridiales bacterium]
MALKVNSIEPKNIKVDDNGTITELTKVRVSKDDKLVSSWNKTYKLTNRKVTTVRSL